MSFGVFLGGVRPRREDFRATLGFCVVDAGLFAVGGRASGACPARLADKTAVRAALAKADAIILDVRTEAEYRGLDQEKNPRRGHLPNSVNIPHTRLLNAFDPRPATQPAARMKGRLKPRSELRALFEAHGITPDRPIITHCQSGGRAALAAMALVVAGYRDVSNYYASFGEWSADPELPVIGPRPSPTSAPAR